MENSDCYLKYFEEQIYDTVNLIYIAEKHSSFNKDCINVFYQNLQVEGATVFIVLNSC